MADFYRVTGSFKNFDGRDLEGKVFFYAQNADRESTLYGGRAVGEVIDSELEVTLLAGVTYKLVFKLFTRDGVPLCIEDKELTLTSDAHITGVGDAIKITFTPLGDGTATLSGLFINHGDGTATLKGL